ncbi:hypothetical protein EHQ68_06780 [Leptospira congkakensis]|uniref:Uncharacterized protein n=1 Tax=Leptospira congkakensis TaxID=2484932 RepID=A0A4Z1A8D8_9LEPT|nr:hypothetical protein [Leptospira congkakensis]TGL87681.1 hypothetical protein EHQ69_16380 [Leptospira congkakensis]TGL89703.1 hypothetical protein EHQ68_06780 [Leptospira congkakensis]TGL95831.1 hypothetical protein EHQ70_12050 [Leptospira congkakensis]
MDTDIEEFFNSLEPVYNESGELLHYLTMKKRNSNVDECLEDTPISKEEMDKLIDIFHKETKEYITSIDPFEWGLAKHL